MRDVAIVGGGPIGLFAASNLAKQGYDVVVFEEHGEIGTPSHCSGLFSTHIFDIVGKIGVLHPSRRARIISPSGKELRIGDEKIHGYVVDRVEFDRELARMAIRNGVDIHLKERVKKVRYPIVETAVGEYRARVIVGADGINSVVRKSMRVSSPGIIGAAQVIAKYDYEDEESVTIFVGNKIAPGFFAWIIPLYDGMAKVGMASYGNSWTLLKKLLKRVGAKPLSISGGGIPIGTVNRTYSKGVILVGDSAGQVKATSGGGVYPGLRAALCAIDTVKDSLKEGDFSEEKLKKYEQCWKSAIGKELANAQRIHNFYRKISDEEFDKIVEELNRDEMIDIINRYGDIDYPSRVAWKLFKKNPKLFKYLGIALRKNVK